MNMRKLNKSRRSFVKAAIVFPSVLMLEWIALTGWLATPSSEQTPHSQGANSTSSSQFPTVKVVNASDLNGLLNFNYPLDDEPNVMVKLGQKAPGGVGPDGDVVAFSLMCTHAGCPYDVNGSVGECPCHGSSFDLANSGAVLHGPAQTPLPQVVLDYDATTGDIFATGMSPPMIYGHTGPDYVSADLEGGTPVPEFPAFTFPLFAAFVFAIGMAFKSFAGRVKRRTRAL
jgi:arsenite oxidase small subunit